jgi:GT2 family glycosyltransferase
MMKTIRTEMNDGKVPRVALILLNWNSSDDSRECLDSLTRLNYSNFDVIILDNASKKENIDGMLKHWSEIKASEKGLGNFVKMDPSVASDDSLSAIAKRSPNLNFWCLLLNDENYGFAEGCNMGIRYAKQHLSPDYFLLLNNDTVVDPQFLTRLVEYSEVREDVGILGPLIYYYDYNGRKDMINMVGGRIDLSMGASVHLGANTPDVGQYKEPVDVEYVEGSCMLIKRKVVEKIGLLNSAYFAYWEETDYCVRAERAGFKVAVVPMAKIWHKVSASVDSSTKSYYFYRNRLWFVKDNASARQRAMFCFAYMGFILWYELALWALRPKRKSLESYMKGTRDGLFRSSRAP